MIEPEKLTFYMRGLAEGLTHAQIAARADVSVRTVYNWRRKFINSMGCSTIFQAILLFAVDYVAANNQDRAA
jgi:DNA-binding NarL/FixJ family response regulator